jgi:hypothetical protein
VTERGLLSLAEEVLGWPSREEIFRPKGGAKRVLADSADRKIGGAVRRLTEDTGARVGILAPNPGTDVSDSPLALVCEFPRPVSDSVISETQRLAWNFSLSPLLVTVEPHLIRSFTCCEQEPWKKSPVEYEVQPGISREQISLSEQAARSLHWVNLITGQFFHENEHRFKRGQRADQALLNNLKYVRKRLLQGDPPLDEDVCHDLLARVIFIQFLMDRRDSKDRCALDSTRLEGLCGRPHLWEVLQDRDCAYDLFRLLNRRFNGDLFAGDDKDPSSAEQNLLREKEQVDQSHLNLLAELVQGDLVMERSQLCLWRQYSFDVIPLEFISSIYEAFVTKRKKTEGIYYTPQQIVDFVLDGVLPWDGTSWDLKIMDPSCGSGVFLVKAFQRLVYRWISHTGKKPSPAILRQILERNILGVDNNRHAVRVASFSLYLAMCEQIEPVSLWEQTSFPKLRGQRIICADFFNEEVSGFRTMEDAGTYDLIIGNAPWGKGSISESELAPEWAEKYSWPIAQENIGPVFLPKSAALAKPNGTVSMLQPAKALLFNRGTQEFRKRFFEEFKVEEVTNLAAVRFHQFEDSDSPVCIITFRNASPNGESFSYVCPKPGNADHDKSLIIIDPQDVNIVYPQEASTEPTIWTALMWGGRRDLAVIKSLQGRNTLAKLVDKGLLKSRGRIIRGKTKRRKEEALLHRPLLQRETPLDKYFLYLPASQLEPNADPFMHYKESPDLSAFEPPQLILRQSWSARWGRFMSFVVQPDQTGKGLITSLSFVTVHGPLNRLRVLETACLTYNSILSVYYLLLTSGQFAAERPKVLEIEALSVPIPDPRDGLLKGLRDYHDVDDRIRRIFGFSDVEWALIADMTKYIVPYFKSNASYPADPTKRERSESELKDYAEYFLRVLRAGFGEDKRLTCVAFVESESQPKLPVRLLAVYLDSPFETTYDTEELNSGELYGLLNRLYSNFMDRQSSTTGGVFFQRIARIYDVTEMDGKNVPTVYIIKPDQARYWTRSMALRDADEVAADIMSWRPSASLTSFRKGNRFDSAAHLV